MLKHPRTDGYYHNRAVVLSALRFYPEEYLAVGYCSDDPKVNPVALMKKTQKLDYIKEHLCRNDSDAWRGTYQVLQVGSPSSSSIFSLDLLVTTAWGGRGELKIPAFRELNKTMIMAEVVNPGIPGMPPSVQTMLEFQPCQFVQ